MYMGKYKKNKPKREKKEPIYRTKEERQAEVKKIISTLSDLKLDPTYEPIKILYKHLNEYVNKGERIKINIPFQEIQRRITGILAISIREQVWIRMEKENF